MQAQPTAQDDGPVVYVIQGEHGGPVKIGYCARRSGVALRLAGIQTGNPYPLVVRNIIPAPEGIETERALQRECAPWRLAGEWFLGVRRVCEILGIPPRKHDPEASILEPLIWSAFQAGVQHGREMAERDTREMFRAFFGRVMPWLFGEDHARDLEVRSAEVALRAVLDRGESRLIDQWAKFEDSRRPRAVDPRSLNATGADTNPRDERSVA